jgi:serine/threonine protein kinase
MTTLNTCPSCSSRFAGGETYCPIDGTRLKSVAGAGDSWASSADPLIGTTLGGRYRVIRKMGEGGMGVVYEAEHVLIEKRVAIKVLRSELRLRHNVVERFRQEAKSASQIGHPNIVAVSDFGESPDGCFYYVMEKLEGVDLADVLYRERALPGPRAVRIALQCCRALGAAHAKGIIHRDVKPENIFVMQADGADFVKVVDFGVAKMNDVELPGRPGRKLTKTGMIFGTPEYMAPEYAEGGSLDHSADIYALGIILYEMLSGWLPFEGNNFMTVLRKHAHEPVKPLKTINPYVQISPELEAVIMKALQKKPSNRFQSMEEMAQVLLNTPEMSTEVRPVSVFDPKVQHRAAASAFLAANPERQEHRSNVATTVHRAPSPARPMPSAAFADGEAFNPSVFVEAADYGTDTDIERENAFDIGRESRSRFESTLATRLGLRGRAAAAGLATAIITFAAVALVRGRPFTAPRSRGTDGITVTPLRNPEHLPPPSPPMAQSAPPLVQTNRANESAIPKGAAVGEVGVSSAAGPARQTHVSALSSSASIAEDKASKIIIRVSTTPPGARLTIVGKGKVCSRTPCELRVTIGDKLTLLAELNGARVLKTIRARESSELLLALKSTEDFEREPRTPVINGARSDSDLKVPDLFR